MATLPYGTPGEYTINAKDAHGRVGQCGRAAKTLEAHEQPDGSVLYDLEVQFLPLDRQPGTFVKKAPVHSAPRNFHFTPASQAEVAPPGWRMEGVPAQLAMPSSKEQAEGIVDAHKRLASLERVFADFAGRIGKLESEAAAGGSATLTTAVDVDDLVIRVEALERFRSEVEGPPPSEVAPAVAPVEPAKS